MVRIITVSIDDIAIEASEAIRKDGGYTVARVLLDQKLTARHLRLKPEELTDDYAILTTQEYLDNHPVAVENLKWYYTQRERHDALAKRQTEILNKAHQDMREASDKNRLMEGDLDFNSDPISGEIQSDLRKLSVLQYYFSHLEEEQEPVHLYPRPDLTNHGIYCRMNDGGVSYYKLHPQDLFWEIQKFGDETSGANILVSGSLQKHIKGFIKAPPQE